jgi:hypothetical protein
MLGYFGGLTHGLIRTAYAVRSFPAEGKPSELELDELAHGLAYWAGTYTELPGNPDHHDGRSIHAALQELPRVELGDAAGPGEEPKILAELSNFAGTIENIPRITNINDAVSRHTALIARLLLSHREVMPVHYSGLSLHVRTSKRFCGTLRTTHNRWSK